MSTSAPNQIPIIDIFAGPGGLGEGFSSIQVNDESVFKIKLSIEKDVKAHETLRLRSFFRQFSEGSVPEDYYDIIREKSWPKRKALINELKTKHEVEWENADEEAWNFELPYPEEYDKDDEKRGGYSPEEIASRHILIDNRIKQALGDNKDFLLIGGPPCQAYSLAGRSRNQGISNTDHRVHLYKEYLRIIAKHQPAVFVMENVKGLLSSEVDGVKIFQLIKRDLRNPSVVFPEFKSSGYRIFSLVKEPLELEEGQPRYKSDRDYLIKSEDYDIPQKRHRVILLGVREDIDIAPTVLTEGSVTNLIDVISDLPSLRSEINRSFLRSEKVKTDDGQEKTKRYYKKEKDSDELWQRLVKQFRSEIVSMNGFLPGSGPTKLPEYHFKTGSEFINCDTPKQGNPLAEWYKDKRLGGVANHQSRSHLIEDLKRYLFASMYTKKYGKFPRLKDYARHGKELLPDHENVESGKFADRFRVQLPDDPATTVTSHISKDGHYFIHYDSAQCRSLTVREAARIQTFPDNYLFCGTRTAQYHQVGNAVPPYLAKQIGEVVLEIFNQISK